MVSYLCLHTYIKQRCMLASTGCAGAVTAAPGLDSRTRMFQLGVFVERARLERIRLNLSLSVNMHVDIFTYHQRVVGGSDVTLH